LKKSREPWDEVISKWEATSSVRYNELTSADNVNKPIQEHIAQYLPYELARGAELVSKF
jgi:hypothetical protein